MSRGFSFNEVTTDLGIMPRITHAFRIQHPLLNKQEQFEASSARN
jgi:hypothetical protein